MKILDIFKKSLVREPKEKTSHYPSESSSCIRQLFYKWKNVEPTNPIGETSLMKMSFGNALHTLFENALRESDLPVLAEVPFKKKVEGLEHPISGRLDGLCVDPEGLIRGIEVKTTFGRGIREIRKTGKIKPDALSQILIYMECMKIDLFHAIYLGRDDGYSAEFVYEKRDDGIYYRDVKIDLTFDAIRDRFKEVEIATMKNVTPEREYEASIVDGEFKDKFTAKAIEYKGNWQCKYCQYRNKCWEDVLKEKGKFIGEKKII